MSQKAKVIVCELGLPVFPCNPETEQTKSKTPLIAGGFTSASLDLNKVKSWWQKFPDAAIGVPTGASSGIVVVDIDIREHKNGEDSIRDRGIIFDKSCK